MVKLFKKDMKETDEVAESIAKMRAMAGVGPQHAEQPAYMKAKKDNDHQRSIVARQLQKLRDENKNH